MISDVLSFSFTVVVILGEAFASSFLFLLNPEQMQCIDNPPKKEKKK